jgi:hypothetical protein
MTAETTFQNVISQPAETFTWSAVFEIVLTAWLIWWTVSMFYRLGHHFAESRRGGTMLLGAIACCTVLLLFVMYGILKLDLSPDRLLGCWIAAIGPTLCGFYHGQKRRTTKGITAAEPTKS